MLPGVQVWQQSEVEGKPIDYFFRFACRALREQSLHPGPSPLIVSRGSSGVGCCTRFQKFPLLLSGNPGKWYECEQAENGHLLFDALGNLPDHREQVLLLTGLIEPDHQDGGTVFLAAL